MSFWINRRERGDNGRGKRIRTECPTSEGKHRYGLFTQRSIPDKEKRDAKIRASGSGDPLIMIDKLTDRKTKEIMDRDYSKKENNDPKVRSKTREFGLGFGFSRRKVDSHIWPSGKMSGMTSSNHQTRCPSPHCLHRQSQRLKQLPFQTRNRRGNGSKWKRQRNK